MYKFYIKTLEYFIEARNNHTPYKYMIFKDDLERYKNDLYFDDDVNSFKISKNDIFAYFKRNHKTSLDNLNNLGYCFYYGIGADMNKSKAEKLFINAGKKVFLTHSTI